KRESVKVNLNLTGVELIGRFCKIKIKSTSYMDVNCSLPDYYCCFGLFSMDFCCDFHSTIYCSRYFCETGRTSDRSEEYTSELQSRFDLVCLLLIEKKKTIKLIY